MITKPISYSRINTFLNNKSDYIKRYILGLPTFETKEMRFGKMIAEKLEKREFVLEGLPTSNLNEERLNAFTSGHEFIGYADSLSCSSDCTIFDIIEYKTGKTEWTQERTDNSLQLEMYNMLAHYGYGATKTNFKLVWIKTYNDGDNISLTGEFEVFERTLTDEDAERTREFVLKTIQEMEEFEKQYHENNENKELDKLCYTFADIQSQIKALEAQADEIKAKVQEMTPIGHKIEGVGSFYYTGKKRYSYSDNVKSLETQSAELAQKLKELKKEEEISGTATLSEETKTLAFRVS